MWELIDHAFHVGNCERTFIDEAVIAAVSIPIVVSLAVILVALSYAIYERQSRPPASALGHKV